MRRSRRIFRPQTRFSGGRRSAPGAQGRPALLLLLLCLLAILGLGASAIALRHGVGGGSGASTLARRGTVTAAAIDVAVVDGDTLRLNQTGTAPARRLCPGAGPRMPAARRGAL